MRGNQLSKQIEAGDEREKARGVLLYLEERYTRVDEKITNFDTFPTEILSVLKKYICLFNLTLRKSKNVKPVKLNVVEESVPRACYSCRPTPAHYKTTTKKLVDNLLDQEIIAYCGDKRSEWCAPANFVEEPGKVPLALRLIVDFSHLHLCLIRDQLHVFSTGE